MQEDMVLLGRAALLSLSLICQRIAAAFGRLAIRAEARYHSLTAAAHG